MEPNKLEKQFRDQLNAREIQPSAQAWDRLDAMLSVAEEKKTRKPFGFLFIAAGILVLVTLGLFFFNQNDTVISTPNTIVGTETKNDTAQNPAEIRTTSIVESQKQNKAVAASDVQPTTHNNVTLSAVEGQQPTTLYIVTESVFSMDGDSPNIEALTQLAQKYNAYLAIDEAHALGVFGEQGEGLVQSSGLQDQVFARIMTFGKGLGCHGAAILGSAELKSYLVNFARSFIYTTGLSPHSVAAILVAYQHLAKEKETLALLKNNIIFFNQEKLRLGLKPMFVYSKSAIQSAIIPGDDTVKNIATQLQQHGFDVKPILSPTVPEGQERLRFCLHSYNSEMEILNVLELLSTFVF